VRVVDVRGVQSHLIADDDDEATAEKLVSNNIKCYA
jgi:hypothetical protein